MYRSMIWGQGGIKARIVADSVHEDKRITTMELEYPRFIHSEFMTHRVFSRNSASSRAIPTKRIINDVWDFPAIPINFGKNQAGMQAGGDISKFKEFWCRRLWCLSSKVACFTASAMDKLGLHKQVVNRILEPFQFMKVVVTSTEWENFYSLRMHKDAQPEIQELARVMFEAHRQSHPTKLLAGDYHVPYYNDGYWTPYVLEGDEIPVDAYGVYLKDALKVSASCCAQVSFRKLDNSTLKADKIYDKLIASEPMHASPFEHQATPIYGFREGALCTDKGITGINAKGEACSGNLVGWNQHRQLL